MASKYYNCIQDLEEDLLQRYRQEFEQFDVQKNLQYSQFVAHHDHLINVVLKQFDFCSSNMVTTRKDATRESLKKQMEFEFKRIVEIYETKQMSEVMKESLEQEKLRSQELGEQTQSLKMRFQEQDVVYEQNKLKVDRLMKELDSNEASNREMSHQVEQMKAQIGTMLQDMAEQEINLKRQEEEAKRNAEMLQCAQESSKRSKQKQKQKQKKSSK